jgi:D-aminoacyl-tRNA deacylase
MRIILQRVREASVTVDGEITGKIGHGMLLLVGFEESDTREDAEFLSKKLASLRIFNDNQGKMNLSITDVQGDFLVVSQFTLHADTRKGNRPSFIRAARPETAIPLYEHFIHTLRQISGREVHTGIFGAMMEVRLCNDGPVTISLDSRLGQERI